MRLVICDYSGHPFQVELSRALAARGHHVLHLYFKEFETPHGNLVDDMPRLKIIPVTIGRPFDKMNFLKRRPVEQSVGGFMGAYAADFNADVVVACNMPIDSHLRLRSVCRRRHGKAPAFVFWHQDIYSHAIYHYLSAKLGMLGRLIGRYYQHLEAQLARTSAAVIPISTKFLPQLMQWHVDEEKISVIPNWAPLGEIYPVNKDNAWAREHGLVDKKVALYTGTLGLKHDPALLVDLAKAGAGIGLHVVVVSQGAAAPWLNEQSINNLIVLPFQPIERYPEVLGTGDVMLAMIGEEAAGFSIPSKILSYLAAGKPVVAAIKSDNDAAVTVERADAGVIVAPGDYSGFVRSVFGLVQDAEKCATYARNARQYAEREFAIDQIAGRFENVFNDAVRGKR